MSPVQNLINRIWKQVLPPKIKLFAWSLVKGKLQTSKRLGHFLPNVINQCPMCHNHEEDQDHLFLHCQYAKHVWNHSNEFSLPSSDNNLKINDWLNGLSHQGKHEVSCLSKALAI